MPIEGYVISHTHWDREWYLTFQEYRLRLLKVIDKAIELLLNNPKFKSFMLDGQTSILEDYLEIRKDKEEIIRFLVTNNKLIIGPWYTQPDEAIVSPESIIRNLLIGHRIAVKYGRVMRVGYLPDTFGHTPQLPQILRGFDIDTFVFMRGLGDEKDWLGTEFYWEAPDGSRVLAIHMDKGYCNSNMLGLKNSYKASVWKAPDGWISVFLDIYYKEPFPNIDEAYSKIKKLYEELIPETPSKTLLLMNGCDHMPPQAYITDIIDKINSEHPELLLKHVTLEEYVNIVKSRVKVLKVFKGELRGAKSHPLLVGVLSSRIYLKQLNYRSQLMLEKYAEPLSTIAFLHGHGYPYTLLWKAWKLVLENQAHDSIYGSGIDPLHRENETRFLQSIEISSNLAYEALRKITEKEGDNEEYIVVYNPSSWKRTDIVKLNIIRTDEKEYELVDLSTGNRVVLQRVNIFEHWRKFAELIFMGEDVPPLGFKVYKLMEGRYAEARRQKAYQIENEFYRIQADPEHGGMLKILDKSTGKVYEGFNVFVDGGDAGDEYNYSPPKIEDKEILSTSFKADVTSVKGPVLSYLEINLRMMIPKRLNGQKRSDELVEVPIRTRVYLYKGSRRIDIETTIDNKAKDHRFRVRFPTGLKTSKSYADYHFYVIERSIKPISEGKDWVERPPTTHPQHYWVEVSDGKYSVMIANKGLPEYEVKDENGAVIYLTLFRSVGWLSRDDLTTRRGHAGPPIPTPDAQCLREMKFEYSIILHSDDWLNSKAYVDARNFAEPLMVLRSNGKPPVEMKSYLEISPIHLILTAFKKAEDNDWILARFYNISGKEIRGVIKPGYTFKEVWKANLNEKPIYKLDVKKEGIIELDVRPHEIVTLLFKIK
ncbi:MAG: hypothetical protein B6U94_04450 [Thermofilum sp. ex4484_79]|nr:MAG: hypothetical protein B6U94_04450 [Thermofilum sp. ex4484_79]